MQNSDYLRIGIALLAALGFVFFAVRINDDWKSLSKGWRVLRFSMLALVGATSLGVIRLVFIDPPLAVTPITWTILASLVGLLIGLWVVRHDDPPQRGGFVSAAEIRLVLQEVEHTHGDLPCADPKCLAARASLHTLADKADAEAGV